MLSFLVGWKGYAAAFALGLLIGAFSVYRVMSWHEAAQQTAQAKETVRYVIGASNLTYELSVKYEGVKANDQKHTNDILGIVPVTITPAIDISYPVPCAFVRVWNAAAGSPIPDTACQPDDSASGVALSDVAETTVKDFGRYDQVADQLRSLQDWVKGQQALSEKAQ